METPPVSEARGHCRGCLEEALVGPAPSSRVRVREGVRDRGFLLRPVPRGRGPEGETPSRTVRETLYPLHS